jgi:hypothetical protein
MFSVKKLSGQTCGVTKSLVPVLARPYETFIPCWTKRAAISKAARSDQLAASKSSDL